MKSANRFYVFFTFVFLLSWNPLIFWLIYRNTPSYASPVLRAGSWIILIAGTGIVFLLSKGRLQKFRNLLLLLSFTGMLFTLLVAADRMTGLLGSTDTKRKNQPDLIYEDYADAHYKTTEFEFEAHANNLGLRDRNISIDKKDKFRILCIGDSWTFGWGVNVEDSWPRVLQTMLHRDGFSNAEVINCGESGQFTGTYKEIAAKTVPLLKPDLVLVGVLQADDLSQSYESTFLSAETSDKSGKSWFSEAGSLVKTLYHDSFHNFRKLILARHKPEAIDINKVWKNSVNAYIKQLNQLERMHYNTFNDSLKTLFTSGNLNPGLLNYYLDFPDRFYIFNNPEKSATRTAARLMRSDLEEMKRICNNNQTRLVFIDLPEPAFTGHHVCSISGDILNNFLFQHNHVDSIYRSIATELNLPFLEMTKTFKNLPSGTGYFYRFDGHPTKNGYRVIAGAVAGFLEEEKLVH